MAQRLMAVEPAEDAAPAAWGTPVGEYAAPRARRALRVVYLWDADYPWDVRAEKICATLTSAGHDVHIVARNRARRPLVERLPEGTVHRMRPWPWAGQRLDVALGFPAFFNPRWVGLLGRTMRAVRPDVLVARDLPLAPTALYVAGRHRVPVVLDMAENYPAMMQMVFDAGRHALTDHLVRNPRAVAAVERYALARVDRVLVVIEEMAERLRGMGVPADRIHLVSNTPPAKRAEGRGDARRDRHGPLELVYLGLLEVPRGVMDVVEATAILRDSGVKVHTTIMGSGRDREMFVGRAAALGLGSDCVNFLGYVPNERAREIVAEAEVGLLPHHANEMWNTTVPNKLFDYMAAGLSVVSSDAVPAARIVHDTGCGVVYRSADAGQLADAVRQLTDTALRRACAERGRCAVRRTYNWERETRVLTRAVEVAGTVRRGTEA